MEALARVDERGRILVPKEIRDRLRIRGLVKLVVEDNRLVVIPVEDPLEELTANTLSGTRNVAEEIRGLRRAAEEQALREAAERWL